MYRIGIDVGSTYTKYCIMDSNNKIDKLFSEKTPIRQREYFESRLQTLKQEYPDSEFVSCGYGKRNVLAVRRINELTALAMGTEYVYPGQSLVLDIGGQDTKIIRQEEGTLKEFFINDKCAAGSGMFLSSICNLLGKEWKEIQLFPLEKLNTNLSSVCAVFAQSEIVELIADNIDEDEIISAVVKQILIQAKKLLLKVPPETLVLSGGLSQICNIKDYVEEILGVNCILGEANSYLSAIGCARRMGR